jgi:hypothetical protein
VHRCSLRFVPKSAGATNADSERSGDPDGSLSAPQVVSEYQPADQPAVLEALTDAEFQRGVFAAWRDRGTLVYIQIYQFRHDREAADWAAGAQRADQAVASSTATFDEIEGGRWCVSSTPDGRSGVHAAFNRATFAVMIDTFSSAPPDLKGIQKLAVEQYGRLP